MPCSSFYQSLLHDILAFLPASTVPWTAVIPHPCLACPIANVFTDWGFLILVCWLIAPLLLKAQTNTMFKRSQLLLNNRWMWAADAATESLKFSWSWYIWGTWGRFWGPTAEESCTKGAAACTWALCYAPLQCEVRLLSSWQPGLLSQRQELWVDRLCAVAGQWGWRRGARCMGLAVLCGKCGTWVCFSLLCTDLFPWRIETVI